MIRKSFKQWLFQINWQSFGYPSWWVQSCSTFCLPGLAFAVFMFIWKRTRNSPPVQLICERARTIPVLVSWLIILTVVLEYRVGWGKNHQRGWSDIRLFLLLSTDTIAYLYYWFQSHLPWVTVIIEQTCEHVWYRLSDCTSRYFIFPSLCQIVPDRILFIRSATSFCSLKIFRFCFWWQCWNMIDEQVDV